MAVLQMLSEVISAKELLCLIAFAELVRMVQMLCPSVPIGRVRKLLATESTNVGRG